MNRTSVIGKSSDSWFLLPPEVRKVYKNQLVKRDGQVCSRRNRHGCGKHLPLEVLSIDHIIPISMGGPVSDILNMQLLCSNCHQRKTRHLDRKAFNFLAFTDRKRPAVERFLKRTHTVKRPN